MAYTRSSSNILLSDLAQQEIGLLNQGFRYDEIAALNGQRSKTIQERNRCLYKINMYDVFKMRVLREGIPNRLKVGDDFGYYFAGLFDGEGCFVLWYRRRERPPHTYDEFRLAVQIQLRSDDAKVLQYAQENIGGSVLNIVRKEGKLNPATAWRIEKISDLTEIIIPLFDKYPLHSKKAAEYQHWRKLVIERYYGTLGGTTTGFLPDTYREQFFNAMDAIKGIRTYTSKS